MYTKTGCFKCKTINEPDIQTVTDIKQATDIVREQK